MCRLSERRIKKFKPGMVSHFGGIFGGRLEVKASLRNMIILRLDSHATLSQETEKETKERLRDLTIAKSDETEMAHGIKASATKTGRSSLTTRTHVVEEGTDSSCPLASTLACM